MTDQEQVKKAVEECNIPLSDRADHAAIGGAIGLATGAIRGAATGSPQAAAVQAGVGLVTGVAGAIIKDELTEKACKEKEIRAAQPILHQAQAPKKPVNCNANYAMSISTNRIRAQARFRF